MRFAITIALLAVILYGCAGLPPEGKLRLLHAEYSDNAKEFFWKGGKAEAVLLIHGIACTPAMMRPLGKVLNEAGYTVNGIILRGHGTSPLEMETATWRDWRQDVQEAYDRLKNEYGRVIVVGYSMGGDLALALAAEKAVSKLVCVAAPMKARNGLLGFTPILQHFQRFDYPDTSPFEGEDVENNIYYQAVPLRGYTQLLALMDLARSSLPKVTAPALVIQSEKDNVVSADSPDIIFNGLGSPQKKLVWLKTSNHLCVVGPERQELAQAVLEFITKP